MKLDALPVALILSTLIVCLTVLVALRIVPWETLAAAGGGLTLWLSKSPLAVPMEERLLAMLEKSLLVPAQDIPAAPAAPAAPPAAKP